jgi:DNA-binding XRE family transcriptional regulator
LILRRSAEAGSDELPGACLRRILHKRYIAEMAFTVQIHNERIAERRKELRLTQEEAAVRAGLRSRQAWNDIERGRKTQRLTAESLYRIAVALSVRMEDLIVAEWGTREAKVKKK